jgi:hypothetical protein
MSGRPGRRGPGEQKPWEPFLRRLVLEDWSIPARIRLFPIPFLAALGIAFGLTAPAEACTNFCLRDGGRILRAEPLSGAGRLRACPCYPWARRFRDAR